uniref:Uncharacterized protein n=1 Tax=Anguilla anguilla TaxID=7936 RepID=A0A0E9PZZ8_ANGAN
MTYIYVEPFTLMVRRNYNYNSIIF